MATVTAFAPAGAGVALRTSRRCPPAQRTANLRVFANSNRGRGDGGTSRSRAGSSRPTYKPTYKPSYNDTPSYGGNSNSNGGSSYGSDYTRDVENSRASLEAAAAKPSFGSPMRGRGDGGVSRSRDGGRSTSNVRGSSYGSSSYGGSSPSYGSSAPSRSAPQSSGSASWRQKKKPYYPKGAGGGSSSSYDTGSSYGSSDNNSSWSSEPAKESSYVSANSYGSRSYSPPKSNGINNPRRGRGDGGVSRSRN